MDFEQFEVLGDETRARYKAQNFNERLFPDIAQEVLNQADINTDFQLDSVADFLMRTKIPQQAKLNFSNLPPIVYSCPEFYIEMLVWMDATTSIHQHAFSGAFRVLKGASLHSTYEFEEHERLSSRLLLGETKFKACDVLRTGDVQAIRSGRDGLLHALFHLERPSITLVIRTKSEPWARPQYLLLPPNIAFAAGDLAQDPTVLLLDKVLDVAAGIDATQCANLFIDKVTELDFPRLFMMFQKYGHYLRTEPDLTRFLDQTRKSHGALVEYLLPLRAGSARAASLISSRESVKDPDLRFFLALLLNLPNRAAILSMIAQEYPEQNPEDLCAGWLQRLSMEESTGNAFLALAQKAKLGSDRFGAKLKAMLPSPEDDPETHALLLALASGTLGSFEANDTRSVESLQQLPELAPLLK